MPTEILNGLKNLLSNFTVVLQSLFWFPNYKKVKLADRFLYYLFVALTVIDVYIFASYV